MATFQSMLLPGALALAALALSAEAAPRGRVVRVERGTLSAVPRLCSLGGVRSQALCFGHPRVGERIMVLDLTERTVRGELVIESVGDASELTGRGVCISSGGHLVRGSYASGVEAPGHTMGLRGAQLDRRTTRVLIDVAAPTGRAEESVELALDTDGNGRPDLIVTNYMCDERGELAADAIGRCYDTYMRRHGTMHRVQQDIFQICR